jgi:hypothetical protein
LIAGRFQAEFLAAGEFGGERVRRHNGWENADRFRDVGLT